MSSCHPVVSLEAVIEMPPIYYVKSSCENLSSCQLRSHQTSLRNISASISYWKGRGNEGTLARCKFHSFRRYIQFMHCTCEASISKSTFCFATIQLKAEHNASVSGAAAYQPRAWWRTKLFLSPTVSVSMTRGGGVWAAWICRLY